MRDVEKEYKDIINLIIEGFSGIVIEDFDKKMMFWQLDVNTKVVL